MKKFRWAFAACLAATLSVPVSATADNSGRLENQTVRVTYNDLDIHSTDGAKQLYARLKRASTTVCGVDSYVVLGSIERKMESKECYRETLDRFVKRIDSDMLERLHNS